MTKYAEELDTASAVLAAARADRAIADAAEARLLQHAVAWAAMHSVDSIEDAATIWRAGTATPGCRWRVRVRRWWRSSRSPSSPPRSGCPPMPGSGTSATPSSCAHRLPRVWRRVVKGDLRAWLARGSPTRPCCSHPEAAAFVDRHVAPCGAQDRPRPARTPGGRGDRDLHARPGRGTPAGEGRRPVLHGRAAADLLRRHRRGARRAGPGRRPRPRTGRRRARRPAQGPGLGGLARTSAGRPRSASSPATSSPST